MVIAFVVMLLFSILFLYHSYDEYKILVSREYTGAFSAYSAKTYPIFMELKRLF